MKNLNIVLNGVWDENPTFRQVLAMCPTLAVTTAAVNGLGMGLATTFVLICSNLVISLLRNAIPDKIRIPSFIIIIATFATIIDLLLAAYVPVLSDSLGIYIPLIVVNCLIFARAEGFAFRNGPVSSILDGLGMGLGFTLGLTLLSILREWIGAGTIFGLGMMPPDYEPMMIVTQAPGGFIALGLLLALMSTIVARQTRRKEGGAK